VRPHSNLVQTVAFINLFTIGDSEVAKAQASV